jgi:hypothetical protein
VKLVNVQGIALGLACKMPADYWASTLEFCRFEESSGTGADSVVSLSMKRWDLYFSGDGS